MNTADLQGQEGRQSSFAIPSCSRARFKGELLEGCWSVAYPFIDGPLYRRLARAARPLPEGGMS